MHDVALMQTVVFVYAVVLMQAVTFVYDAVVTQIYSVCPMLY